MSAYRDVSDPDRARRYTRLAFFALGILLALVYANPTDRARSSGRGATSYTPPLVMSDEMQLLGGLTLAAIVLGGLALHFALQGRRQARVPRRSWLREPWALVAGCATFGIGGGVATGWLMEWEGDDLGLVVPAVLGSLAIVALAVSERGRLPFLALGAGWLGGIIAAALRLWSTGYRRHYYDEVFLIGSVVAVLSFIPLSFLRSFVASHHGDAGTRVGAAGALLPLEVLGEDGAYLIRVETPGLLDPSRVEVKVKGARVRLRVPKESTEASRVIYSTRPAGVFETEVLLPAPVESEPQVIDLQEGVYSARFLTR